ncbi:MAG TPA: hypothetical protein PLU30_25065 [Verrucomicrobiae bacterium]|nr:hypothetical protein [Verrucomicrobiae bacterium]
MRRDAIEALGEISSGELLHAWPVCARPQAWWIQVNAPRLAVYLGRRRDCRRVAYSVAGEYLRTYEIARTRPFVERLIKRMLRGEHANEGSGRSNRPRTRRKPMAASAISRNRRGAFQPARSGVLD